MSIPGWQGRAAAGWQTFTPREAGRAGLAPAAFNRVASALLRYQSAFQAARAEAQAAINDAATAERATANAQQEHQTAERVAALAAPGTPESIVAPFADPGAVSIVNANARYEAARATLQQVGDEVAAEIRAAGGTTSGEAPGIEWWEQVGMSVPTWFEGLFLQAGDTVVGIWEMLPIQYIWDDLVNDGDDWWEQYFVDLWGGIIDSVVTDPLGALDAMWGEFIAADHWDGYVGEGAGRVTFNVASFAVAGVGALKVLKGLKGLSRAEAAAVILNKPPKLDVRVDHSRPGGHLFPDGFDPLGGLRADEFATKHWDPDAEQWDGSLGGWRYPPDNGFDTSPGVPPPLELTELPTGFKFDRFGDPEGSYVSPEGTPFPERALPPDAVLKDYHVYKLVKPFDDSSGYPVGGAIAAEFEQPGGGTQIKLPKNVAWLEENDYIEEVPQ
nr:TNT domain-containing protein [Agromyces italicus]